MFIGLLFVCLAVACGLAVNRVLRVPLSLSPLSGLASMAVLTLWCSALGAPPLLGTGLVVVLALAGVATSVRALGRTAGRGPADAPISLRERWVSVWLSRSGFWGSLYACRGRCWCWRSRSRFPRSCSEPRWRGSMRRSPPTTAPSTSRPSTACGTVSASSCGIRSDSTPPPRPCSAWSRGSTAPAGRSKSPSAWRCSRRSGCLRSA